MALAFQCDICKEFCGGKTRAEVKGSIVKEFFAIEVYIAIRYPAIEGSGARPPIIDICPECARRLIKTVCEIDIEENDV